MAITAPGLHRGRERTSGHQRPGHQAKLVVGTLANLSGTDLSDANVEEAKIGGTILADVDLSRVEGLDRVEHLSPSSIGVDTIFRSQGKIPSQERERQRMLSLLQMRTKVPYAVSS